MKEKVKMAWWEKLLLPNIPRTPPSFVVFSIATLAGWGLRNYFAPDGYIFLWATLPGLLFMGLSMLAQWRVENRIEKRQEEVRKARIGKRAEERRNARW